jgi:hypothetical protein
VQQRRSTSSQLGPYPQPIPNELESAASHQSVPCLQLLRHLQPAACTEATPPPRLDASLCCNPRSRMAPIVSCLRAPTSIRSTKPASHVQIHMQGVNRIITGLSHATCCNRADPAHLQRSTHAGRPHRARQLDQRPVLNPLLISAYADYSLSVCMYIYSVCVKSTV